MVSNNLHPHHPHNSLSNGKPKCKRNNLNFIHNNNLRPHRHNNSLSNLNNIIMVSNNLHPHHPHNSLSNGKIKCKCNNLNFIHNNNLRPRRHNNNQHLHQGTMTIVQICLLILSPISLKLRPSNKHTSRPLHKIQQAVHHSNQHHIHNPHRHILITAIQIPIIQHSSHKMITGTSGRPQMIAVPRHRNSHQRLHTKRSNRVKAIRTLFLIPSIANFLKTIHLLSTMTKVVAIPLVSPRVEICLRIKTLSRNPSVPQIPVRWVIGSPVSLRRFSLAGENRRETTYSEQRLYSARLFSKN